MKTEVVGKDVGKIGPTVVRGTNLAEKETCKSNFHVLSQKLWRIILKKTAGKTAFRVKCCLY